MPSDDDVAYRLGHVGNQKHDEITENPGRGGYDTGFPSALTVDRAAS